jgi:hypothetical protein
VALIVLSEYISVLFLEINIAFAPKASAERTIAPKFPGS